MSPTSDTDTSVYGDLLHAILSAGARYGRSNDGAGKRVLVEFVSTNPNGPISVTSGRSAALGDAIASLLAATGFDVTREFYVNDAINPAQMDNFGKSVMHRYRQLLAQHGSDSSIPDGERGGGRGVGSLPFREGLGVGSDWLYAGEYVTDIARAILAQYGSRFEDANIDDPQIVQVFRSLAQDGMIAMQKADLTAFDITFDNWFSEASLHASGRVKGGVDRLTERGFTYEKDGSVWLRSTVLGDDNDRVLLRANGTPTYIAGDAAYHKDKFDRGFDLAVDVWGADHAGYVARTKAAVAALGYDPDRLQILLYQPVRLVKDGEFVKTSKRHGDVLELKSDLIDEIGRDAARFMYLTRPAEDALDVDIDLAKRTGRENPVYTVQQAHARLSRFLDTEAGGDSLPFRDGAGVGSDSEIDLLTKLSEYPAAVQEAAGARAPHQIATYLRDLSTLIHAFCDDRAGNADSQTPESHEALAEASAIVLRNALALLGLDAWAD